MDSAYADWRGSASTGAPLTADSSSSMPSAYRPVSTMAVPRMVRARAVSTGSPSHRLAARSAQCRAREYCPRSISVIAYWSSATPRSAVVAEFAGERHRLVLHGRATPRRRRGC